MYVVKMCFAKISLIHTDAANHCRFCWNSLALHTYAHHSPLFLSPPRMLLTLSITPSTRTLPSPPLSPLPLSQSSMWEIELSRAILRSASTEDDWEVDPDHIFVKEKLGEGSFGEVYRGQLTSDVKCLRAKKHVEDMCFVGKKEERSCSVAIKLLKSEAG